MWVALDTMSGDHGPEPIILGGVMAIRELKAKVILVGDETTISRQLKRYRYDSSSLRIVHSDEYITMTESPGIAIKKKKNASVLVAARLTKEKEAIGFFSPGNTGATMAAALKTLGRLPGVVRPAIATPIPRDDDTATVLIDAGANVNCRPINLIQFSIMGEVYSREILKNINPRIGILSNGEEDKKGVELTQIALQRIKKLPFNCVGYVEGKDMFGSGKRVDVVACDGFIGNIVLKTAEGCAQGIFNTIKNSVRQSKLAKTGALLLKNVFFKVKQRMNYASYGGAPLMGVNGVCIIGHGSSNAWAVRNAVRIVREFSENNIISHTAENIKRYSF